MHIPLGKGQMSFISNWLVLYSNKVVVVRSFQKEFSDKPFEGEEVKILSWFFFFFSNWIFALRQSRVHLVIAELWTCYSYKKPNLIYTNARMNIFELRTQEIYNCMLRNENITHTHKKIILWIIG